MKFYHRDVAKLWKIKQLLVIYDYYNYMKKQYRLNVCVAYVLGVEKSCVLLFVKFNLYCIY